MPSRRPQSSALVDADARSLVAALFAALLSAVTAAAQDVPPASWTDLNHNLLLGIVLNNRTTDRLATFRRLMDGSLAATPADLRTAGIRPELGRVNSEASFRSAR
jgi:outer membrane usher protein